MNEYKGIELADITPLSKEETERIKSKPPFVFIGSKRIWFREGGGIYIKGGTPEKYSNLLIEAVARNKKATVNILYRIVDTKKILYASAFTEKECIHAIIDIAIDINRTKENAYGEI